jgi:hypothetical protein
MDFGKVTINGELFVAGALTPDQKARYAQMIREQIALIAVQRPNDAWWASEYGKATLDLRMSLVDLGVEDEDVRVGLSGNDGVLIDCIQEWTDKVTTAVLKGQLPLSVLV